MKRMRWLGPMIPIHACCRSDRLPGRPLHDLVLDPVLVQRLLHAAARAELPPSGARWSFTAMRATIPRPRSVALRLAATSRERTVAEPVNRWRTQNGHIRNDTRDISRRRFGLANEPVCSEN